MLHVKDQLISEALIAVDLPRELRWIIRRVHLQTHDVVDAIISLFAYHRMGRIFLGNTHDIASRIAKQYKGAYMNDPFNLGYHERVNIIVIPPDVFEKLEYVTGLFGITLDQIDIYESIGECKRCDGAGVIASMARASTTLFVPYRSGTLKCGHCGGSGMDADISSDEEIETENVPYTWDALAWNPPLEFITH